MESDSESRSNSSLALKSPKTNISDVTSESKGSHSEDEKDKNRSKASSDDDDEDDCEIMEVDPKESPKKSEEKTDLHNGDKVEDEDEDVVTLNESDETTPLDQNVVTESPVVEPDSTDEVSPQMPDLEKSVSDSISESESNAEKEAELSESKLSDGENDKSENKLNKEDSDSNDGLVDEHVKSSSMEVDVQSKSANHVDSSSKSDTAVKESSHAENSTAESEKGNEIVPDILPILTRKDSTEACERDSTHEAPEKSGQKEKGIGIDAIAKKLGLQIKVNNEGSKDNTTEVNEEDDAKPKDESQKDNTSEDKKDSASEKTETKEKKKSKKSRTCEQCGATKKLRFQVLFQGKMRYLCSEVCFKNFKETQKTQKTATPPPSPAPAPTVEICAQCKKEVRPGKGYYPSIGPVKALCSVDCMINYQEYNIPKKKCSQCKAVMDDELNTLTWETMEFCNEDCLGKFQSFLGSHCSCCQSPVQQTSLGKYCVCFGADIRQFCSGSCLEEFKKGLKKICSFCQKDLSAGPDGFLAPVGDKGQFKDFCSQRCMERYEYMNTKNNAPSRTEACAFCNKMGNFKIHVDHGDISAPICSENCIAGYRYKMKLVNKACQTCFQFFETGDEDFQLQHEGVTKFFCSKPCMTLFVLSNRKIIPCSWCKVKKYNFDMIEKLDSTHQMQNYCSLNCISLFRVSLSATSAKSIRCDQCTKTLPAQFHLTMSDGSIRNFCTYQCVAQFQNQFSNAPSLTTSTSTTRPSTVTTQSPATAKTTASPLTPVISSVVSLAGNLRTPPNLNIAKIVNPPKLVPHVATPTRATQPAITILTSKTQTPVQTACTTVSTNAVASSSSSGTQVIREVIVKPQAPKSLKNKAVLCKPLMLTKGITCRPHPCHKSVQTEEGPVPTIVPIPVPIYVPTPVHMFSRPVPCPVPFPVPVPVPIFVPLSKDSPAAVLKQLKDIQEKIPSNPYEAELLMMAEMVAENDNRNETETNNVESLKQNNIEENFQDRIIDMPKDHLDVEAEMPSGIAPVLQRGYDFDNSLEGDCEYTPKDGRQQKRSAGRGRGRGKRPRVEVLSADEPESLPPLPILDDPNSSQSTPDDQSGLRLKYTFGVNAWKHWIIQKNMEMEKSSEEEPQSARKLKFYNSDMLQMPHDELNYMLCLFVQEVRKPNGDEYAPASIYYLCLGIQQNLFENGRIDNIFTDCYFEKFTDCLNGVLLNQVELITTEGFLISRIEEEVLWESKQLGAHSPHVLLNTLMFFNAKYFNLKAIDDHAHLSFSHITKHWRKTSLKSGPRNVVLRYYPPLGKEWQRNRKNDSGAYEQCENTDNQLRCPVKLYEFYVSKCPESVKTRNDVFYLHPERSCVPDSPVWYATQPLGRDAIAKMLQRIKAVREVYET